MTATTSTRSRSLALGQLQETTLLTTDPLPAPAAMLLQLPQPAVEAETPLRCGRTRRLAKLRAMKQTGTLLVLIALSIYLGSCGFWNLDPAERLGHLIEREVQDLNRSKDTTASFDFVPDASRVSKSPRFTDDIEVRVIPYPSANRSGDSTILVSDWFRTTYHNRFVRTTGELKATKKTGDPFRIVLQKSGGEIHWTDLK